jgi:pilus assembly protein Flp/PilA
MRHGFVAEIERDSPVRRRMQAAWEPERRHQVERAKLIPMRAYLALTALRDREEGQAMVEYALILALVSVAAVGILSVLGKSVSSIFSEINQDL